MMATRPPGRSTRAISASVAVGFGDQLQHGEGDRPRRRLVAQGQLLRVGAQEADIGTRLGVDRAGQHRLGDVDAERKPVGACGAGQ